MKKVLYIAASALLFTSCESFLDTESYTKKTTGNYPVTEKDAIQMVTGVYATMNRSIANCQNTYFYLSELASDDRFGVCLRLSARSAGDLLSFHCANR